MTTWNKKILFIISVLLIMLVLRDVPYINLLTANKVWLAYVFLLVFLLFPKFPKKGNSMIYFAVFLFFIALILTLFYIANLAEAFGIIIYFLLWLVAINEILHLRNQ